MPDRVLEALSHVMPDTDPRWPCTVLVANIVRHLLLEEGAPAYSVRDGGPWWQRMNVWDDSDPWSCPREVARSFGFGARVIANADQLRVGIWYVAQGWRRVGRSGHAWLMRRLKSGLLEVVESSESLGFRHHRGGSSGALSRGMVMASWWRPSRPLLTSGSLTWSLKWQRRSASSSPGPS